MRMKWALVTCGFTGLFGLAVLTAEKAPEAYVAAMKTIGAATGALNKSIQAEDFDAITKNVTSIIDTLPVVDKYWSGGKADDAKKWTQTAVKAAADLRVAAGLKSSEGVAYSAKELTETCAQCHTAHREKLPDGSFEVK
jgi:cytochrome c556